MPDNKNALPLGTILNVRYEIEGLVGGGGFGLVYRAKHLSLNNIVAIKELFPRDIVVRQDKAVHPISDAEVALYQKVLNSFRKEGQRLARLGNCPSIVRCQDYFEENGTGYLVMEYVEGKSLRELVRTYRKAGKSFSEDALVSLLKKLLAGLKEVHKAGIQHMDIKPENIYLRQADNLGELSSPVLLDFGAARSQTGHSTGSSLLVGTVPYAPLEQMYEGGAIGPWTDIYALGITLYELVFGGVNIPGSTERVSKFHGKGIDPLESARSKGKEGYSEKFLELIDKSIEIKAEDRPQSVAAIEALLEGTDLSTVQSSISTSESSEYQGKQERDKQETGSEKVKRIVIQLLVLSVLVGSGLYLYEEFVRQPQIEAALEAEKQARLEAEKQARLEAEKQARLEAEKQAKLEAERQAKLEAARQAKLKAERRAKKAGDTFRDCVTCPEMVVVPSGSFIMGSPAFERDRYDREGPQHRVTISKPFAVGKYEVTVGQFEEFVNKTRHPNNEWRNPKLFEQSANYPVVNVSWEDAKAYTEWLSEKTGQNYRLLSEAEWEYVARAGTTTAYHFGATISPTQANYDRNNDGTVVVGSYPANAFGLHDMHGNVWEWVEDCPHDNYNGAPTDGSAWTSDCDGEDWRVLRGGSWNYFFPGYLRSANRFSWFARYGSNVFSGFRIARTLTSKVGDTSSEEIKHPPISSNKEETPKQVGDTFRDCATCPEMVVVPSGSFMMGSPRSEQGRYDNEGPQHRVTISKPFAVGKYEVTRGQFAAFVDATGYGAGSSCWIWDGSQWREGSNNWRNPGFTQSDTHSVVCISWNDAQSYVSWLSRKTGHNYRLLSEAEWEYVARAGTTTPYHFGRTISPSQANYGINNNGTVMVGSYPANAFGLHDVHGNVWEWVEDCWHDDYNGAPSDGSAWTINCDSDRHVLRGGSWGSGPRILRSADRGWINAGGRNVNRGFRIARDLTP